MIIEKIQIDSFGNLQDKCIELSNGVNIIEGANESGKSTIAAFIRFVFYGLSNKSIDKGISERDRYINWNTGSAGGFIELSDAGGRYRVERTMIVSSAGSDGKKAYREGVQIVDLSNNSPVKGETNPGEYFFGVDKELFEKTAFVSQLTGTKVDGSKLLENIENILFSASENINITKALKKLDASRVLLLHKNGGGGKIFELETKAAAFEAKLEDAKRISEEILNTESSLREAKNGLESALKKRDKLKCEIKGFENSAVLALFDKLHSFEKSIDGSKGKLAQIIEKYTVDNFFPDESYLKELEKAIDELETARNEGALIEKELEAARAQSALNEQSNSSEEELERIKETYQGILAGKHTNTVMATVFAIIAFVFVSVAFAGIYFDIAADIGKILLFSAALPLVLFVVFLSLSLSKAGKLKVFLKSYGVSDKARFEEFLKAKETESRKSEDLVWAVENKHKNALERTASAENKVKEANCWRYVSDPEENLKAAIVANAEATDAKAEYDKLCEMKSMLEKQLEMHNEAELRESFEGMISVSDVNAANVGEKRREYEFYDKASETLDSRIHELEKTLASLYPQAENPARIAEKIELAKSVAKEYRKKHAAYLLAYSKIEEAGDSMRDSISPKLADFTSKIMSELTCGKYSEIGINSDLKVTVRTESGMRELEYLSAGTQDIVYVSLRLALINTLFRKNSPPVIFDESFSRLDDTRLWEMLNLLNLTSKSTQSILLTSNSRETHLAKELSSISDIKI